MEKTLQVLNTLVTEGAIKQYAIGGAVGATFYVEPLLTFDLDIFVIFPQETSLLVSLSPLYETLRKKGYKEEAECVDIEGVPVQFLPAYNPLLVDALDSAIDTLYEQTKTRVLKAEHLMAICIQTGRDKDKQRLRVFLEQAKYDKNCFEQIIQKHGLTQRWQAWNT